MNPENSTNQPAPEGQATTGGLPLRGLAMVLIAVAVLLGLWGLYSLTQGDDGNTAASGNGTDTATIEQDAGAGAGDDNGGDPAGGAAPAEDPNARDSDRPAGDGNGNGNGDDAAATDEGRDRDGERDGDREGDGPAAERDRDRDAAGERTAGERAPRGGEAAAAVPGRASASASAAEAEPVVNVLNNSTVNGLAEKVYERLEEKGTRVGEHGNLPGDVVTLGETTVYYQPGDSAGERAARDLGARIGDTNGVPVDIEPNIEDLPKETTGPGNITLVLIGEVVL